MAHPPIATSTFDISLRARSVVVLASLAIALTIVMGGPLLQAQTFQVIHAFTGGADGGSAIGGLTIDAAGNLYGTTAGYEPPCGAQCGNVFKMKTRWAELGGNLALQVHGRHVTAPLPKPPWCSVPMVLCTVQPFLADLPVASNQNGCGTVFRLTPQPHNCAAASCPWTESVLYRFAGGSNDGAFPYAKVAFDQAGNLYGTTSEGGVYTANCYYGHNWCGTIFELTHTNGNWTESLPLPLHRRQ